MIFLEFLRVILKPVMHKQQVFTRYTGKKPLFSSFGRRDRWRGVIPVVHECRNSSRITAVRRKLHYYMAVTRLFDAPTGQRKRGSEKTRSRFLVARKWSDCSASKQKERTVGRREKGEGSALHRSLPETWNRVLKRVRLVSPADVEYFLFTRIICLSTASRGKMSST